MANLKIWTIDEFLEECEKLCRNQYTYDYSNMPDGICNGHKVGAYQDSWHSIVIDNGVCTMALINDKYPNGNSTYIVGDKRMTALEYVRYELEQ